MYHRNTQGRKQWPGQKVGTTRRGGPECIPKRHLLRAKDGVSSSVGTVQSTTSDPIAKISCMELMHRGWRDKEWRTRMTPIFLVWSMKRKSCCCPINLQGGASHSSPTAPYHSMDLSSTEQCWDWLFPLSPMCKNLWDRIRERRWVSAGLRKVLAFKVWFDFYNPQCIVPGRSH